MIGELHYEQPQFATIQTVNYGGRHNFRTAFDEEGNRLFVLRDELPYDYSELLTQRKLMVASGLAVASCSFFEIDGQPPVVAVDYIYGMRFDRWLDANADRSRDVIFDHAKQLADYSIKAAQSGSGPMVDITAPYQFIWNGERPVLVDIGGPITDSSTGEDLVERIGEDLCQLAYNYTEYLSIDDTVALIQAIDELYADNTGDSIVIPGTTTLNSERFDWVLNSRDDYLYEELAAMAPLLAR